MNSLLCLMKNGNDKFYYMKIYMIKIIKQSILFN